MRALIHYTDCPVCGDPNIGKVLTAKDHTVSGEEFEIWECRNCHLRFTQDVPDQANIGAYYKSENYISHTNTSKGMINRLYQAVRSRTLKQKRKLIQQITGLASGRLLDVGSGTGAFVSEMSNAGWDVTGLEPDRDAREVARQTFNVLLLELEDIDHLETGSFDAITLWHVLEHVHTLHQTVDKLIALLKPGTGRLFIAVPNYHSGDASSYGGDWAAYDVPRHLYHFSPGSMQVLMEKHNARILQKKPMWFDSFYVSMLSSSYRHGKTNLPGAGLQGLRSNIRAIGNADKCSSVIYVIAAN